MILTPSILDALEDRFGSVSVTSGGQEILVLCPFCHGRVGTPDRKGHLSLNFGKGVGHCLAGDVWVWLTDGTHKTIREIVDQKLSVAVWSKDDHGQLVSRRITDWFKRPAPKNTNWWVVRSGGGSTVVTGDHNMWTERGWVATSQLREGKGRYKHKRKPFFNSDRGLNLVEHLTPQGLEALCGTLMGDASLDWPYFEVSHGPPQFEYLKFLANKFKIFTSTETRHVTPPTQKKKLFRREKFFKTIPINARFLEQGKVVSNILKHVGPLGLAIWFCDDGNTHPARDFGVKHGPYTRFYAHLHTEGFSTKQRAEIIDWFHTKFDIIWTERRRSNTSGKFIACDGPNSTKFFEIISPYVPMCMRYKLPEAYRDGPCKVDTVDFISYSLEWGGEFNRSKQGLPSDLEFCYDITVEDTHCFFASRSRHQSPLLHQNCVRCDRGIGDLVGWLNEKMDLSLSRSVTTKDLFAVVNTLKRRKDSLARKKQQDIYLPEHCVPLPRPGRYQDSLIEKRIRPEEMALWQAHACVRGEREGYVIFPFYHEGRCCYWQGRAVSKEVGLRKINPSRVEAPMGKSHFLYTLPDIQKGDGLDTLYLVEGNLDAISTQRWVTKHRGEGHLAASLQGTALSFPDEDVHPDNTQFGQILALHPDKVCLLFDPDARKKAEGLAEVLDLCGVNCYVGHLQTGDPNEVSEEEFLKAIVPRSALDLAFDEISNLTF